jgi:hypothetical protein
VPVRAVAANPVVLADRAIVSEPIPDDRLAALVAAINGINTRDEYGHGYQRYDSGGGRRPFNRQGPSASTQRNDACFLCGKMDHWMNKCPLLYYNKCQKLGYGPFE